MNMSTAPRTVRCPRCQGPALFDATNRYRPFCSERCHLGDLGAWANEEFRVPVKPTDPLDDDPQPAGPSVH